MATANDDPDLGEGPSEDSELLLDDSSDSDSVFSDDSLLPDFSFPHDPQDNGVMDHMVRMTTSIHSPLIATGCRPLCPNSPPEIGKRRFAVPELLERHSSKELEESIISHTNGSITSASPPAVSATSVSLTSCCQDSSRRESMPSGGTRSFIPRSMAHRNSIFPSGCIPKIEVTKSGELQT